MSPDTLIKQQICPAGCCGWVQGTDTLQDRTESQLCVTAIPVGFGGSSFSSSWQKEGKVCPKIPPKMGIHQGHCFALKASVLTHLISQLMHQSTCRIGKAVWWGGCLHSLCETPCSAFRNSPACKRAPGDQRLLNSHPLFLCYRSRASGQGQNGHFSLFQRLRANIVMIGMFLGLQKSARKIGAPGKSD